MVLSNSHGHSVPFVIPEDNDVQDFVLPSQADIERYAEETIETWEEEIDLIDYVDYNVDRIRENQALAKAAEDKAAFALKTAKGYKANVEYRRGLIEAVLNGAVSRGFIKKPSLKSAEYSLGIQNTAGRLEIDPRLDKLRENIQTELDLISAMLLSQVMTGSLIEIPEEMVQKLSEFSYYFVDKFGSASEKEVACLVAKTTISWDKKYITQALKLNWLSKLTRRLVKTVKGKALVIRL